MRTLTPEEATIDHLVKSLAHARIALNKIWWTAEKLGPLPDVPIAQIAMEAICQQQSPWPVLHSLSECPTCCRPTQADLPRIKTLLETIASLLAGGGRNIDLTSSSDPLDPA